ncbi:MAG TPA: gamma-glutamyl-gamma-aminobutyrate hydrolase family protein [Solirubrobacteraceae bacterium]|nr:gamma-glutamyl-gamma-aminobutyrate hydrolase family protein [Solirubrobacteraceae bacterium]
MSDPKRPVIGVCPAFERARWGSWDEPAILLMRTYAEAIQRAGGRVIVLAPDVVVLQRPGELLELIDALMLTGGVDIDPALYGAVRHPETEPSVPERDAFEIALARAALAQDLPLLGICRGMQLLNVACGGTLIQHLPDDVGHGEHRRSLGSFENSDHDVRLAPGSLAARAAGEYAHVTKSHHHQGIERLGDGLVIAGWATLDDLPEAIEAPGRRFALGVQWHPEADPSSPVIAALVDAARG